MAAYEYDEAGVMAAYFLITFLALVLVPFTLSALFAKRERGPIGGCQCTLCIEHRKQLSKQDSGSILAFSRKTCLLLGGWSLFAVVCYRVSQLKVDNKVYDPFEILGIKSSTAEKEIKSHFKKLSRMYHPDKVKVTANQTIEMIQEHFVKLTKAYKSLTDEKIRENWIKYNNPDGPQSASMGIALPKWIVEGKNNIWVLGAYGLMFGGALPALVGRWWFGSRQKTKDGINAQSAAAFFKSISEESSVEEVVGALGKAYKWEFPASKSKADAEVDSLEKSITAQLGSRWTEVRKLAQDYDGQLHELRRKALVLLYAHLLRLKIQDSSLRKEQKQIVLQTPLLLNALLNAANSRNWLLPALSVMRLHAFFAQALPPIPSDRLRFTQLPGINTTDIDDVAPKARDLSDVLRALEDKQDSRLNDVKKTMEKWGRVEIVDASFKVIGERTVTPSAIVLLLVKLRLAPPAGAQPPKLELSVDETKRLIQYNDQQDEKFLTSKLDAEELQSSSTTGAAHAPFWPSTRTPSWWIVLADDKNNRLVVPPVKITEIPYSQPGADRDYRAFKMQFQGPTTTGIFTWKVYIVSDTFVGEDVTRDLALKVEEPSAADDQATEDDISEPDEDTLAGQMAAMRGGPVKKRQDDDDSDEDSSTDDDKKSDSDSDSDSD